MAQMDNEQGKQMTDQMMTMAGMVRGTVGASAAMTDGRAELDIFVPTELVQTGFTAVSQIIMMQMMGGMGGGPAGSGG